MSSDTSVFMKYLLSLILQVDIEIPHNFLFPNNFLLLPGMCLRSDTFPFQEGEAILAALFSCLPTETTQSQQVKGFAVLVQTDWRKHIISGYL